MAKSKNAQKNEVDWPACQLMLVIEPAPGARERLAAALDMAQVAAVVIRPKPGDQLGAGEVKPLVDLAQQLGVAALLAEDIDLAKMLRADGVHIQAGLNARERVEAARALLGPDVSVGVDAAQSRHAAMEAGEAGADYVAFGIGDGSEAGRARRDGLIAWWGDIFEIPCVALDLATADEVARTAHDGADFAALTIATADNAETVADLVAAADRALLQSEAQ